MDIPIGRLIKATLQGLLYLFTGMVAAVDNGIEPSGLLQTLSAASTAAFQPAALAEVDAVTRPEFIERTWRSFQREILRPGDGVERRYALIINGDDALRHLRNVDGYRRLLHERYQVRYADMRVLCSSSCDWRYHDASREGFRSALADLRRRLDGDDTLFVYTTGHGDKDPREGARLTLQDGDMLPAAEFAEAIWNLPARGIHYYGDQCFSGAFVIAMTAWRSRLVAAMSATGPDSSDDCSLFTPELFRLLDVRDRTEASAFLSANREADALHREYYEAGRPAPGMMRCSSGSCWSWWKGSF